MKKISRLAKVSLLLAILFGIDKILGVARQMIISRQFGLSAELDVFNAANNLPDLLFNLISGGALAIAFIPVLTEVLNKDGRSKAWELFSNILNIAFLVTALLAILVGIFAKPLISNELGIAPGFTVEQINKTAVLLRLNLISTLIFSLSGLVMAGLQANQHFLFPALAPIFYDLGQIFGAIVLSPEKGYQISGFSIPAFGLGINGLVYGVILGALLHLLIQVPGLIKFKFQWLPKFDFKNTETRKVFKLMGPRLISMLCIQLIFLAQDNLASRLAAGSVTALTYGWWIMQVPETLIGTSIATAILPTLSELFSQGDFTSLKNKIERAVRVMLALTIPIAIIAGVVLKPAVQVFLGLDEFETLRVVDVTRVFLIGIIGHSLVELFVRSFYAIQKPKYPMLGAIFTLVTFVSLGIVLTRHLDAAGIASANTIAYGLQAVLLLVFLNKHLQSELSLLGGMIRSVLAAGLGGVIAFILVNKLPDFAGGLIGAVIAFLAGIIIAALIIRPEIKELGQL